MISGLKGSQTPSLFQRSHIQKWGSWKNVKVQTCAEKHEHSYWGVGARGCGRQIDILMLSLHPESTQPVSDLQASSLEDSEGAHMCQVPASFHLLEHWMHSHSQQAHHSQTQWNGLMHL